MLKLTFRYCIADVARKVQLTTRRGRLRYIPELFAPVEWIDPGPDRWAQFAADLELFGIWNWAPDYYEFTGEEGVYWCVALRNDSRTMESAGYTTFPAAFPLLCGALEALAGRELFDEWDRETMTRFHALGAQCQADPVQIKRRRTFVIDEPDPADPVEDWEDFLYEVRKLPGHETWIDRHIDTAERIIAEKTQDSRPVRAADQRRRTRPGGPRRSR